MYCIVVLFDKAILWDQQRIPTCYIKWRRGRFRGTQVIRNSEYKANGLFTHEVTILNKDSIVIVVGSRSLKLVILTSWVQPTSPVTGLWPAVWSRAREYWACNPVLGTSFHQSFHSHHPTVGHPGHEDASVLRLVPKESSWYHTLP
jgi:hypothetical protein